MDNINVCILDDHEVVIKGVTSILLSEQGIKVTETFHNGEDFLESIENNGITFDVLLLDFSLPEMNGDEVLKKLVNYLHQIKVVVLTSYTSVNTVRRMTEMGAKCFVLKTSSPKEIIQSVKNAYKNRIFLSSEIKELYSKENEADSKKHPLTPLELKVVRLTCEGLTTNDISTLTGLTLNTVKSYRKEIYKKLGIHNLVDLLKFAIEHKLMLIESHLPENKKGS